MPGEAVAADAADARWPSPRSARWRPYMYLPSLIVLSLSTSMSAASEAQFLIQKICLSHYLAHGVSAAGALAGDSITCDSSEIQREIADFTATQLYMTVVPSLFTSIIFGYSSDIVGRKPVITVMALVAAFAVLCPYVVVSFDLPFRFFYLPYLLIGLTGGFAAAVSVGFSSLVDLTTTANRASVMGVYSGITTCISLVAVPLGGYITGNPDVGDFDAFLPVFRLSSALGIVGILLLIFGTSETLAKKSSDAPSPLKSILAMPAAILAKSGPALKRVPLPLLVLQILLSSTTARLVFDTQLSNYRFGWGPQDTSLFSFIDMIASGILTALILPGVEGILRRLFNRHASRRAAAGTDVEAVATTAAPRPPSEESPLLGDGARGSSPLPRGVSPSLPIEDDEAKKDSVHEDEQRTVTVKVHSYLIRYSMAGAVAGALIFASATQGWMWLAGVPVLGLVYIGGTCVRLSISEYVPPTEMALTNSIIGFVDSIAILFATWVATFLYPHYYYMVAAIYSIILSIALLVKLKPPPPHQSATDTDSPSAGETDTAGTL
ncbi:hypothetical protein DFJ73DRAFT_104967 [Zopfochytrium polystomum]|nr:hypothetical protein DFJ73DRAFT_104967 [Zopfochytrium polystomum]